MEARTLPARAVVAAVVGVLVGLVVVLAARSSSSAAGAPIPLPPITIGVPTTIPTAIVTTTTMAEVGLIPPVCATTDPAAHPCPDGVPTVVVAA